MTRPASHHTLKWGRCAGGVCVWDTQQLLVKHTNDSCCGKAHIMHATRNHCAAQNTKADKRFACLHAACGWCGGSGGGDRQLTEYDALCAPVVAACERPEALLACCVPAHPQKANTIRLQCAKYSRAPSVTLAASLPRAPHSPHCQFDPLPIDGQVLDPEVDPCMDAERGRVSAAAAACRVLLVGAAVGTHQWWRL